MNKIISTLLLTVFTAASASAGGQEPPSIYAKLKAKVGAWAEYSFQTQKGDKTKAKGLLRMSIVGKEGDSLWIEQKFTIQEPKPEKDEAGGTMKLLVGEKGVSKVYMKTDSGVMDMSGMMGAGLRKKHQASDKAKITEVGEEEVAVPAGKYKATRSTIADGKSTGDAWIKSGVGPYGLIKQVSREGKEVTTLELLSVGDDAKSEVDEKSAQSIFGAMKGLPSDEKAEKEPAASEKTVEKSAEKPSLGGMFKNLLKKKAGVGGD